MDRRTLIFVAAMTVSLLGINTFFSYWDQQRAQEWQRQQKALQAKYEQELQSYIQEKSIPLSDLPVVEVDERNFGLKIGDAVLAIDTGHLPDKLIFEGKEYKRTGSPVDPAEPAIYLTEQGGTLPTRTLPNFGSYDLQLFFVTPDPSVTPGEYKNSFVTVPLEEIGKDKAPKGPAIALVRSGNGYIPVGIYSTYEKVFSPLTDFTAITSVLKATQPEAVNKEGIAEETFYVLENEFQQLVFSTKGGALSEINLPFKNPGDNESVVKEIGFDRQMMEEDPQNAYFPSRPYYTAEGSGKTLHEKGTLGGYYPLIRRTLVEKPPRASVTIDPTYYALNLVSEYHEVSTQDYKVESFTPDSIVFVAEQPHRRVRKTFSLPKEGSEAPYILNLQIDIEGDSRGLWLTTGVPEVEWISGGIAPALKFRTTKSGASKVESISLPDPNYTTSIPLDWLCNSNGFLGLIVDPLGSTDTGFMAEKVSGVTVPSRLQLIDERFDRFPPESMPGYAMLLPLNSKGGSMKFRVLAGPFATPILRQVDATFSDPKTGYNPDYISSQSFHGWFAFISEPFAKFLMFLMRGFHSIFGSWGFSIIFITLVLKILTYPLNAYSMKSMKKMSDAAPKIKEIQHKYRNDTKKMNMEIANFYRESGVNPLMGCLPVLIQIPFLIGMFDLLKSSFELRGASFIPGWIDNLAAPDVLFSWSYPIPFIGTEFHLLPIIMGALMVLQGKLSQRGKDLSKMTDQEKQMASMGSVMGVLFAFLFYSAPSGLTIYWIFNTIFTILQQQWTNAQTPAVPAPEVVTKKGKNKKG